MDINQLYHLINHHRPNPKTSSLFPFDGNKVIEQAISHPLAIQVHAYMNSNLNKDDLDKALLTFCQELIKMSRSEEQKSVCAKIVQPGQTIVECIDCRADSSCIICMECFKNGNHAGHRVMFKRAGGGCCDCGDPQAWAEEGFCSKHTGKVKEVEIAAEEEKFSKHLLLELFYLFSYYKITDALHTKKFQMALVSLLTHMVGQGLKGIKLISQFFASQPPKCLTVSSQLQIPPLQQLFNSKFIRRDEFTFWQKLLIEMFPYYPFKKLLLSKYFKCFESLYASDESKGQSIACQIVTSYKLIEDYSDSSEAVPIIIHQNSKISHVNHLTKMMIYDLNRINSLQGEAPLKYWKMCINYGIQCIFGYYQSLKKLARKQKRGADKAQKKKQKKGRVKAKDKTENRSDSDEEDKSFDLISFLFRNNSVVEVQYSILQEFLSILPALSKHQDLMLKVIKALFVLIIEDIKKEDNLLIYRPYERMLGLALFYYARQTPFILSNPKTRETIRNQLGISQALWEEYLKIIQERMLETFGFFSHMQTCQSSGYQTTLYIYLVLYASKYNLLGHSDILILRELYFLGAPEMVIDFPKMAKLQKLQPKDKWNFRSVSALITQLGLLYTGSFSQIYVSFYPENNESPVWLQDEAKTVLKKLITAEGGSCSLDTINGFSNNFLFKDEDKLKTILKELCTFNKERKMFQLLPNNYDREPINFRDFLLRTKLQKMPQDLLHPNSTLQFIDKSNKNLFTYVWNEKNINALCQMLLSIHDEIIQNKNTEQMLEYYTIPCRIEYFLKAADVLTNLYSHLTELIFSFEVPAEVRKRLGVLAHSLAPSLEEDSQPNEEMNDKKEQMKLKKMKKLEELKKKNNKNLIKAKEKHLIEEIEEELQTDHCSICKKKGGNLVWVAKMVIRNLEKVANLGPGTLTLSFTSCYHAFDFECISKNSIQRSTHDFLFRCPVCRSLGNVFFSIAEKQNIHQNMTVQASFDRIMHVAMTMRQYTSFDIYQQIFKSFYHLVLLGYLQPDYVRKKRMRLYKQIVSILCYKKIRGQIANVLKKVQNNEICLQPKMVENKQAINLNELVVEEEDDEAFFSSSDEEDFNMMLEMGQHLELEVEEGEEAPVKINKSKVKNKEEKKNIKKSQPSPLFTYTLTRIIRHILDVIEKTPQESAVEAKEGELKDKSEVEEGSSIKEESLMEQSKMEVQQTNSGLQHGPWTVALLDQLLDQNLQKQPVQWKEHNTVKIIELPQTYYWDLTNSACGQCGKICPDLIICLLCGWRGCLANCDKNGIKGHNKKHHGESSAFFRLKDATAYIIGPGEVKKIGCLYCNQWGEDFEYAGDWNSYKLQTSVAKKILDSVLKNE